MKIYVYWNRNDNDCTKIFHFMSPNDTYSISDRVSDIAFWVISCN